MIYPWSRLVGYIINLRGVPFKPYGGAQARVDAMFAKGFLENLKGRLSRAVSRRNPFNLPIVTERVGDALNLLPTGRQQMRTSNDHVNRFIDHRLCGLHDLFN